MQQQEEGRTDATLFFFFLCLCMGPGGNMREPAPIRNAADGTVDVRGVSRPARTRLGRRKTGSLVGGKW